MGSGSGGTEVREEFCAEGGEGESICGFDDGRRHCARRKLWIVGKWKDSERGQFALSVLIED